MTVEEPNRDRRSISGDQTQYGYSQSANPKISDVERYSQDTNWPNRFIPNNLLSIFKQETNDQLLFGGRQEEKNIVL